MDLRRKDLEKISPNIVDVPHRDIMMCLNEGPVNPMKALSHEIFSKLSALEVNRYHSHITDELRKALSNYTGISKDSIAMGNGADELLYYFFVMLRNSSRDQIVYPAPSYFDYFTYSRAVGLSQAPIDMENDFSIDSEKFIKKLKDDNSVACIICNPNNPSGNLIDRDGIIEIIENTEKPVLVDEAYYEFSDVTMIDLINKYPHLFILRTFSKGFLSAGLRFGYILAQPESIHEFRKVMTAFNMSLVIQAIALTYLENLDWFTKELHILKSERRLLHGKLSEIDNIEVLPSHTNFITFRIPRQKQELFEHITTSNIAIRDVSGHPLLADCLRVTIGTAAENELFIKTIRDFFDPK